MAICENHIQSQKTTIFRISLIVHVYNTSIEVPPPPGDTGGGDKKHACLDTQEKVFTL